ncbi:hypothetical protein HER10_EVM0003456 [Colletotrichum scovillei]|uniref:Set domain-containing protein 5 n=1 Tax=Colletotrichum scovillei TaxID=1209932 RepID=A0A9P7U7A3_9PEZI|nr:uncharacterized protein HER10_EVM0003456 [Colletotrichum scovillei]KAF4784055.1 hypothetical protein HER10_EVM0003456 [Colletotrichum scovillei]KAG7040162.1 set domain-containing protein 5 [Colletotrichum scovillei]KAG7042343.1 set domain-containing protein 5 [Colletotrichum scovillei]KAG7062377.1 set domain-containing protein 5 [Colletotrichum scovillei]
MEAINSFPLEAIHPQKQGMALDDFFVDFQVRAKFHTDTHSFHAVLDLAVEAKMANKILSLSKPLEEIKAEFLEFQAFIDSILPPLPYSQITWKTVYIAEGIIVDGDDDEDYEVEEGYYVDWSQGSSASSVTSEGPYQGNAFAKLEPPILLQSAELPLLTTYKNSHGTKERLIIFSNEFFEVRKSPTAGWGAFATKKLYQGDQILVEKALYHAIYADVTTSVRSLPEKERLVANDMFGHKGRDGETHEEAVWNTNAFAAYVPSKSGNKRNMPGLFAVAGRFNHSCLPKIDYKYRASHESLVFTVRAWVIEEGEELTISYGQDPSVLYYKYGFICECGHCRRFDPRKSEWS